jgi:hypothetical protein
MSVPRGTKMFQFPRCPSWPARPAGPAQPGCPGMTRGGLPHSETAGSPHARCSPARFAACRVLPRPARAVRHPSSARFVVNCSPVPFVSVRAPCSAGLCCSKSAAPTPLPSEHVLRSDRLAQTSLRTLLLTRSTSTHLHLVRCPSVRTAVRPLVSTAHPLRSDRQRPIAGRHALCSTTTGQTTRLRLRAEQEVERRGFEPLLFFRAKEVPSH